MNRSYAVGLLAASLLAGCTSSLTAKKSASSAQRQFTVSPSTSSDAACSTYGLCSGGVQGVRMLTRDEYENSVVDLLGVTDPNAVRTLLTGYPTIVESGFESIGSGISITNSQMERLVLAAEGIAKIDPASLRNLSDCFALKGTGNLWKGACRDKVLGLVGRAWRLGDKPAVAAMSAKVDAVYAKVLALNAGSYGLDKEAEALRGVIQYALTSPRFLFKQILQTSTAPNVMTSLSPAETLTRLSFALGGSVPDAALYQAALDGKLATKEQVRAQAARMLGDANVRRRLIYSFFSYWTGVNVHRSEAVANPNGGTPKSSAYLEFEKTLDELIRTNQKVAAVMSPGFTYVDDLLAGKYGLGGGSGWRRVATADRGGILQQASFLGLNPADSAGTKSNGLARGILVLNRFTCDQVAPLTAALRQANDEINKQIASTGTSNPNNLIDHWNDIASRSPSCMACHGKINPAGFPLEYYAPDGSYRTQYGDGGGAINFTSTFLGKTITSPRDLSNAIASSPDFIGCANTRLFAYLTGMNVTQKTALAGASTARVSGRGLTDMILDSVASDAFLSKAGSGS